MMRYTSMKVAQMILPPYHGQLVNLIIPAEERDSLNAYAKDLPSVRLSERTLYDLEMLAIGAFSPLSSFMTQADYQAVLSEMRLQDGTLFPMPITLPVSSDAPLHLDTDIALRTRRNYLIAIMTVEAIYEWDKEAYIQAIIGTNDKRHPLLSEIQQWGDLNITGRLQVLQLPPHYDFPELRLSPQQVRAQLAQKKRKNVIAFQTRNPMNRAQEAMLKQAMQDMDASLLLQPIVGLTLPDDVDHYTRVRANTSLVNRYFDKAQVDSVLLPLAMRMAGEREALLQAIIARNYGASHIPIGPDHATIQADEASYAAKTLVEAYHDEIAVQVLPYQEWVYLPEFDDYQDAADVPASQESIRLSSKIMREGYLDKGQTVPAWFVRPEVADILAQAYPPKHQRGLCIWFTGLSGSGKSTTASILSAMLRAYGRQITLLDGDIVRTNLSKGLGFSKADRDTNIRRIGFVAAEIVRHGGIAICAAISPYQSTRDDVRRQVGEGFIEVFVDTPLAVCEARDTKGLYAKARRGQIKGFTGVDDPYEVPSNPEIHLQTTEVTADKNAQTVLNYLKGQDFIL